MNEKAYVTAKEMAEILKVPVTWIYQKTKRGVHTLPHLRVGKYLRFIPSEVISFIKENQIIKDINTD